MEAGEQVVDAPRVVMCPPTYFDVDYIINPFMDPAGPIDASEATIEYQGLKDLYQSLGVQVYEIEPQPGLSDMTFAANYGTAIGLNFILANFFYEERQPESIHARELFIELGFTVTELDPAVRFEGQGDLVYAGDSYFLGYGQRTDKAAQTALEPLLNKPIVALELVDPMFYHLHTAFAVLGSGAVMIAPEAFSIEGVKTIHDHFQTVVEIEGEDNAVLPCSLVRIGNHVIVNNGLSIHARQSIEGLGLTINHVDTHEFLKSGASIKALTLLLDEEQVFSSGVNVQMSHQAV